MYAVLLATALRHQSHSDGGAETIDDAVGELHRCRGRIAPRTARAEGAPQAVADQIGYDVALIRVARLLGVRCGAEAFERPERERERLEAVATTHGVGLEDGVTVEDET
jgi:hypothetical protein